MQTCKHAEHLLGLESSACHPTFHDPTSDAILPRDAVVEDGLAGVETAGVALTLALVLDEIVGLGLVDAASLLADVGEGGRNPKSDTDTDADTDVKADGDHLELGLTLALALEDVEVLCVVDATPGTTVLLACVMLHPFTVGATCVYSPAQGNTTSLVLLAPKLPSAKNREVVAKVDQLATGVYPLQAVTEPLPQEEARHATWSDDVTLEYRPRAAMSPRNTVGRSTRSRLEPEGAVALHTASPRAGATPSSMHPGPPLHLS
jgi:hypothetical protein